MTAASASKYTEWSKEDLISRIEQLEAKVPGVAPQPATRPFDFTKHSTRKIALRFSYAGSQYGGLAFQMGVTPLPTVEGVLFDAFSQIRLVDPQKGFEGCGWERCGRTDRGVSGAGQVVSLWVRSALPAVSETEDTSSDVALAEPPRELRYISMLNRVLPPTIRALAWSPVAPTFSARFACKYRHYKYFFHPRGLDIPAMQNAAARLMGEHDFRNLCKLDPSKQISNFKRTILRAEISPVDGQDGIYVFDLVGTAFLYNQVRHIVAVLFLIGSGMEKPDVMSSLLDTDVVDRKPEYQMADGLPLVLWDCAYEENDVQWRVDDEESGLYRQMRGIHERSAIHTALDACFLQAISGFHADAARATGATLALPLGGGTYTRTSKYIPLLDRKRQESAEVVNERWRLARGQRS